MIACLLSVGIYTILCLLVLWVLETIGTAIAAPPPIFILVRVLIGVLIAVRLLSCLGLDIAPHPLVL